MGLKETIGGWFGGPKPEEQSDKDTRTAAEVGNKSRLAPETPKDTSDGGWAADQNTDESWARKNQGGSSSAEMLGEEAAKDQAMGAATEAIDEQKAA